MEECAYICFLIKKTMCVLDKITHIFWHSFVVSLYKRGLFCQPVVNYKPIHACSTHCFECLEVFNKHFIDISYLLLRTRF